MGMHKALAALVVMCLPMLCNPLPVLPQTWDEVADPEKAYRNCMQNLMDMMSRRDPFERVGCPELLRNPRKEYDQWDQKAKAVKPRLDQATELERQWNERLGLVTDALERAEPECRASYFSSSAACQRRDRYKKEQQEANFNWRKADEIRRKLDLEYGSYVAERDGWANRYQDCKAMERSSSYVSEDRIKDQQLKCQTLYTLMEYSSSGKTPGPTTGEPKTPTTKPPSRPQTPTTRTVKIG